MFKRYSSMLFILIALIACNSSDELESLQCSTVTLPAISIKLFDADTGETVNNDSQVTVTDGDFSETKSCPNDNIADCDAQNLDFDFQMALERMGTYEVIVQKEGYITWSEQDVVVTRGICHVNTVSFDVQLEKVAEKQGVLNTTLDVTDVFEQATTTFSSGEDIVLNLNLNNISSAVVFLIFRDGQKFDYVLKEATGEILWQWSGDKFFTQAIEEVILGTDEFLPTRVVWDQRFDSNEDGLIDGQDELIPVGEYTLEGYFTYDNYEREVLSYDLTIN